MPDTVVVVGIGGMGQSVARRLGSGSALLLADRDADALDAFASSLSADGHQVTATPLDVADADAVAALAGQAQSLGSVRTVVHTAGLSPVQAPPEAILRVDLLGVAHVLEEFGRVIAPGGAGVVISSMAGHMGPPIDPDEEALLARTPARELGGLAAL
ncbi:MAG TPA: SDR family NAD(P)-dependent oxidoreductase, partial [Acidimicrobiales bacterium]|nr:SDR family NAD(P)-dependent oxidoreductase [Acidimicrobiales bacterium]